MNIYKLLHFEFNPVMIARQFSTVLMNKLPGAVESVILCGEQAQNQSEIKLLIVLNTVNVWDCRVVGRLCRSLRFSLIKPVLVDHQFIKTAVDTFPMELIELKENYSVIAGEDCIKDIVVVSHNLRHQCEYELKNKILSLRKKCLQNTPDHKLAKRIVLAMPSFLVLFKNILRLKNIEVKEPGKILGSIVSEFDLDRRIFTQMWQAWSTSKPIKNPRYFADTFLKELDKLAKKAQQP